MKRGDANRFSPGAMLSIFGAWPWDTLTTNDDGPFPGSARHEPCRLFDANGKRIGPLVNANPPMVWPLPCVNVPSSLEVLRISGFLWRTNTLLRRAKISLYYETPDCSGTSILPTDYRQ